MTNLTTHNVVAGDPKTAQPSATVMVFTKTPELGKVKTRLAESWGAQRALQLYQQLVNLTLRKVASSQLPCQLHIAGPMGHPLWQHAAKQGWPLVPQRGDNLGERMYAACRNQRSILVGCDFPGLSPDLLRQTNALLSEFDVVAVPATDGGYVLLAMNAPQPALFNDIAWGSDSVWAQTLEKAQRLQLRVHAFPAEMDLDTAADWLAAKRRGLLDDLR